MLRSGLLESTCHPLYSSVSLIIGHSPSLKRDGKGRFDDGALAKILQDSTEWSAGAFRARGTPEVLRVIEILSIEQARSWGTCSVCCCWRWHFAAVVDYALYS